MHLYLHPAPREARGNVQIAHRDVCGTPALAVWAKYDGDGRIVRRGFEADADRDFVLSRSPGPENVGKQEVDLGRRYLVGMVPLD